MKYLTAILLMTCSACAIAKGGHAHAVHPVKLSEPKGYTHAKEHMLPQRRQPHTRAPVMQHDGTFKFPDPFSSQE